MSISRPFSNLGRPAVLLALAVALLLLAGCQQDPNDAFIQGVWVFEDPHVGSIPGESNQRSLWSFHRGAFENSECCFVDVQISGYYRVLESEGDDLKLELYNISGRYQGMVASRGETRTLRLVIDREAETLKIGRAEPYVRISP